MPYRLNGDPWERLPLRILAISRNPTRVAMELLYEHIAQCKPTDEEEMTLP
jgi:hypothetical protein